MILTIVLFSVLGGSQVMAMPDGDAKPNTDLSAEHNFLRFKKEINHVLPGQSFFRINFNTPHPDHNKGGFLRKIKGAFVKPKSTTPSHTIPNTTSKRVRYKGRIISSTVAPYKTRQIETFPKSEPKNIIKYTTTTSSKPGKSDSNNLNKY